MLLARQLPRPRIVLRAGPADGLDWPCTSSETGPEGYHVGRFAAAMRRGLITGADFAVVVETAGVFTNATLVYDVPLGGGQ
jgi:hypothetical protein